ncbi:MAG: RNA polymerase sigma factor [Acidobacteriota bacterium]
MVEDAEVELAALVQSHALERAATRALEIYGDEVYGFLINVVGNESDAAEVFGQLCEDMWRGLPAFEARSSVRTWLYVLARHAASRFRRAPWHRGDRRTGSSGLDELVARTYTRTNPWQRTDVKDRFAQLRESLDPDDRALLVLRVDRGMPWGDIARITLEDETPDERAIARETDRLAKRFQRLKEQLRDRAREAGLIDEASSSARPEKGR